MGACFSKKKFRYKTQQVVNDKVMEQTGDITISQNSNIMKFEASTQFGNYNFKSRKGEQQVYLTQNQKIGELDGVGNKIRQYMAASSDTVQIKQKHERMSKMQVDYEEPYGIKNLPEEWEEEIRNSSILISSSIKENPKAMIQIISTFDELFCESVISKKIITARDFERIVEKVQFIIQNPSLQFNFVKQIGSGGMCRVLKATAHEDSNSVYAVRVIKIKEDEALRKIKSQIAVMHICCNPNIIEHHFTYYYQESLFMFIEFMNAGSLAGLIKSWKNTQQDLIAYILKEILEGLKIIHKKSQIHRDVKSDNILLNSDGQIKIADFGFALQLTRDQSQSKDIVGTPAWMAPELIKKQTYNQSIDIWALGIVAFELCNREPPYLRINPLKAMYMIVSQPPPTLANQSPELTSFAQACLQKDPANRSTASQLLKHPFITKVGSGNIQREKLKKMIKELGLSKNYQ